MSMSLDIIHLKGELAPAIEAIPLGSYRPAPSSAFLSLGMGLGRRVEHPAHDFIAKSVYVFLRAINLRARHRLFLRRLEAIIP